MKNQNGRNLKEDSDRKLRKQYFIIYSSTLGFSNEITPTYRARIQTLMKT